MPDTDNLLFNQLTSTLEEQLELLPDKPEETAEITFKALCAFASGNPVSAANANRVDVCELSDEQEVILKDAVKARLDGNPLAHITGRQGFMGIEMLASKSALIPRKETEILANLALKSIDEISISDEKPLVIDVCTGCGNLALAVLSLRPETTIYAADLSEKAVELATANAEYLGLDKKINFLAGDLLVPFDNSKFYKKVDLIICNPPYILSSNVKKMAPEISEHEPELAFNGGPFGIQILDRIVKESPAYLKAGGWLCLELGAGQGSFVEKRILKSGFYEKVESSSDSEGVVRALRARLVS